MPASTANSPRLWLASLVMVADGLAVVDDFPVAVEPALEAAEVVVAVPELLVAATKGPMTPPCCCAGVVLFKVLAALALKTVRDSDELEL